MNDIVAAAVDRAFGLLPKIMNTPEARVMLYAIGLQESRFIHRAQIIAGGGKGPARGFWQFERGGGCKGVLTHPASRPWMLKACAVARVEATPEALWAALETDDTLAAVAARLLLYTDAKPLPAIGDAPAAWDCYVRNWRPGKPHRDTWDALYARAVEYVAKPLPPSPPQAGDGDPSLTGGAVATLLQGSNVDPITIAMGLAQFAPAVLKWITGSDKAAEAAGKVVEIAEAVTGKTGPEVVDAIKADPSLVLQFRQAVMAQEADLDKAFLADRQDARKRDVELAKAGRYNWRSDVLALLAVSGLVCCVWFIARDTDMPERAVNAIMFVAGVLAAAVRDVYGFEFGSSRGSKEKDEALAKLR